MSMVIKSTVRGNAGQFAPYLLNNTKNEEVRVLMIRGTASPDNAHDSILEMGAYETLTRSKKGFVQIVANPDNDRQITSDREWMDLIDRIDQRRGWQDLARVAVLHKYDGKWHMHLAYGRYNHDTGTMTPVDNIGYDLKAVSAEHEKKWEHERILDYKNQKDRELQIAILENQLREKREEAERERLQAIEDKKIEAERRRQALILEEFILNSNQKTTSEYDPDAEQKKKIEQMRQQYLKRLFDREQRHDR